MSGLEVIIPVASAATAALTPVAEKAAQQAANTLWTSIWENIKTRRDTQRIEKLMRKVMEQTDEEYSIFMGTLDPMSDNQIAEALRDSVPVNDIVNAIYLCDASRTWLEEQLKSLLSKSLGEKMSLEPAEVTYSISKCLEAVLATFYDGVPMCHTEFTKGLDLLSSEDGSDVESLHTPPMLDLNGFQKVNCCKFLSAIHPDNCFGFGFGAVAQVCKEGAIVLNFLPPPLFRTQRD